MAKRVIGATIKLDGEAQFKRSVAACNSELKTMKSEMALVSEQFKGSANSIEALTAKQSTLEKTLSASQRVVDETAKALANAKDNYTRAGESLEGYKKALEDSQKALAEMKSAGSASADEIKKQEEQIAMLEATIEKGEGAYDRAGKSVQEWQRRLNTSQTEVVKLERELSDTGKYLDEAKKSSDGFATSIDEMGRQVKGSAGSASAEMGNLDASIGKYFGTEKVLEYAEAVSQAFQEVASAAYEATKEVDEGLDTITEKTGAVGQQMDGYKNVFGDVFGDLPVEAEDAGKAIGEVATQFSELDDSEVEKLSKSYLKFAKINDTEVSQAVSGTQSVLRAFNKDATEAESLLDVMSKSGQTYGVSMDKIMSSMTQNSAALRELNMDMYQSVDFIARLEKSGVDSEAVLSGLKRAYTSAAKDGKDFRTVLLEVQDALVSGEDRLIGNQKASELFGRSFANVSQAVRDRRVDFTDLANTYDLLQSSAGTVNKTFDETEDAWEKWDVAVHNLNMVTSDFLGELLEAGIPVLEGVTDILKDIRDVTDDLPSGAKAVIGGIAGVTAGVGILGPKIVKLYTTIKVLQSAGVLGGVAETAGSAGSAIASMAGSIGAVAGPAAVAVGALAGLKIGIDKMAEASLHGRDAYKEFIGMVDETVSESERVLEGFRQRQEERASKPITQESVIDIEADKKALAQEKSLYDKRIKDLKAKGEQLKKQVAEDNPIASGPVPMANGLSMLGNSEIRQAIKENKEELAKAKEEASGYTEQMKALEAEEASAEKAIRATANSVDYYHGKLKFAEGATDEQKQEAYALVGTYDQLTDRLKQFGSDIDAVKASFGENDQALSELFDRTLGKWQTYHDEITDGLKDEVQSLMDSAREWESYKKSVEDSVMDPKSMFEKMGDDDGIEVVDFWDTMADNMSENSKGYQKFVDMGNRVLQSTRYKFDENFRNLANEILMGGVDNTGYLESMVSNIDLTLKEGKEDIQSFLDFSGEADAYSGFMANMQAYTETGTDGIVQAFDRTKSAAEQTMDLLNAKMEEQAKAYADYAQNVKGITESERYREDEDFRGFADQILSQGVAGAENIEALWNTMSENPDALNPTIEAWKQLQSSAEQAAYTSASIKTQLEDDANAQIHIVQGTQEQLRYSLQNDPVLLASGLDTSGLGEKGTMACDLFTVSFKEEAAGVTEDMRISGANAVQAYAQGIESSIPYVQQAAQKMVAAMSPANLDFGSMGGLMGSLGAAAMGGLGGGPVINMTINGSEGQDVRVLADLVTERIRHQLQGVR